MIMNMRNKEFFFRYVVTYACCTYEQRYFVYVFIHFFVLKSKKRGEKKNKKKNLQF